jgi:peroxiredoxin-like protein
VVLSGEGLPSLDTAAPTEFGGPGDLWSPETLLVGTIANCFVLTFRAIARASRLEWDSLNCDVSGTLDKDAGVTQFTRFDVAALLTVPAGTDEKKAHRLLEKAERNCLITSSLKAETHLNANVRFVD